MRKKIFIDTSIFIRYFTRDDEKKYKECDSIIKSVEKGISIPYISNVVILEAVFILTRIYKFSKNKVLAAINDILNMRNLTLIEKTDTKGALKLFTKYNIKYGDCLIVSQIPAKVVLLSYDSDFAEIPSIKSKTPEQFLAKL